MGAAVTLLGNRGVWEKKVSDLTATIIMDVGFTTESWPKSCQNQKRKWNTTANSDNEEQQSRSGQTEPSVACKSSQQTE